MPVKVCKMEIKPLGKLIDMEQKAFYDLLFKLLREHRLAANRSIQYIYEMQIMENKFKEENGEYPTKEDREKICGYGSTIGWIYNRLKSEFLLLNTAVLSSALSMADKRMKNDRKDILIGNKSIPNYNKSLPIELPKNNIVFNYDKSSGDWNVSLSLLSNYCKKENCLKSGILPFKIISKDKNIRKTLEKCSDRVYNICGSKLKYDDRSNKFFLFLSFQFEKQERNLNKDNICIVHIGVFNAVECTTSNSDKPLYFKGGEIENFRAKHEAKKRSLLKQRVACGGDSVGHGTKTRVEPAYIERNIINNFKDTINHRYSRAIIDYAIKNDCGTIQLEDLTGVSERLLFLKTWSYLDLQEKIKNKASVIGIEIDKVKYPKTDEELIAEFNSANVK